MDVLYVTNVVKTDNYYTLKGVIYTAYILTTNEVENIVKNVAMLFMVILIQLKLKRIHVVMNYIKVTKKTMKSFQLVITIV